MEQIVTSLAQSSSFANSLVKPTIIKNVTLLSPGVWTGEDNRPTEYTSDGINKGFENSDWTNMNLYLDHSDTKGSAVRYWIGFVRNVNMSGGELKGDLEVWHPLYSMFIKQAKAKFAVSATMVGTENINPNTGNYDYKINSFKSMSIVDEPGCGNSWLPKMLSSPEVGEKTVVSGTEEAKTNVTEDATKPEGINDLAAEGSESNSNHNCKEVEKMEKENQKEKSIENKEEKSLSESKESSEDMKNLSSKIDKLAEVVTGISETVKSLAAEKESEEESKEESEEEKKEEVVPETNADAVETKEVPVESETETEESTESKELEDTKKELAVAKKKIVAFEEEADSPDQKTLAGANNAEVSVGDANAAMLGFLRETANIPIY